MLRVEESGAGSEGRSGEQERVEKKKKRRKKKNEKKCARNIIKN